MSHVSAPGAVSVHDPSRIAEGIAELVGQTQHLIELQEALIGRNVYDPIIVDLSTATSQTFTLPPEAHQLELVTISSDTAATVKLFRQGPDLFGSAGKLIGQVYVAANQPASTVALNAPVPPSNANNLIVTTSVAIAHGALVIVLARTRPGGYPYAG